MKISADYINYDDVLENSIVKISDTVTLTIAPIEKEINVDGDKIKERKVEFKYEDTDKSYVNTYEYNRQELKQFIKLLQDIQTQLQKDTGNCNK